MPKFFNRECAVVYVDDSADDQFLFQLAVSKSELPLHVQTFFSAEPVITYLKGEPPFHDRRVHPVPAFLLCDYDLKLSEGPELVAAVRKIPSCATLPLIMFSGSDDKGCVLRSYLSGADHYLCKPFLTERTVRLVRSLYHGAMLNPRSFDEITTLPEYQRRPPQCEPCPVLARSRGPEKLS